MKNSFSDWNELSDMELAEMLVHTSGTTQFDILTHAMGRILRHVTPENQPPILTWNVYYTHTKISPNGNANVTKKVLGVVAFTGDEAREHAEELFKGEATMTEFFTVVDVTPKEEDNEDE